MCSPVLCSAVQGCAMLCRAMGYDAGMAPLIQSAPAPLQAALLDALHDARSGGAPRLPRVLELPPERLLRALHVVAVQDEGRWFPCGWLKGGHAPGLLHAFAGGWLYLPEAPTPATVEEARQLGVAARASPSGGSPPPSQSTSTRCTARSALGTSSSHVRR